MLHSGYGFHFRPTGCFSTGLHLTMQSYFNLGASGLKVSRLWLGTMMFGDQTGEAEATDIVAMTRDAGINAIDTADNYANGESERYVGRLIAPDRDRWVLATKLANPGSPSPNDRGLSRRWILKAIDASLGRLRSDWIDVCYMHRDDEETPLEETLSTFARLIELGKIRYYGISNFRAWRVARIVETARRMGLPLPIVCQPAYNAVTRGPEAELLPCCASYGVGVVTYSPLARGVLTGKYDPNVSPSPESRAGRGNKRIFETDFRPESLAVADAIKRRALERELSATQFAIAWVLNNKLVNGVVGGPRTTAQWQEYLSAMHTRIDADDESFIDALVPSGYAAAYGYNDPLFPLSGRVQR
ncbi:aldo/keto reductase [Paraburkholderia sp. MM5477-R1]|uniref:aldo/keto reductase n=1 Tax=Paraburkholderia sp. MM5477-R1 TaxID=2991062 RepID=UPI003D1F5C59